MDSGLFSTAQPDENTGHQKWFGPFIHSFSGILHTSTAFPHEEASEPHRIQAEPLPFFA
jgi:hypothetical protein